LVDETPQKILKLNKELESLREQRDSSDEETKQWMEKRDTINKQVKDLRLEASKVRERRDTINAKVKSLKTQRDQSRTLAKEKLETKKQLKEKLRLLNLKKPEKSADAIRKEKEEIEWTIQTTSLTLQEEKPLVKKATLLGSKLNIYQQMDAAKKKIFELQKEIETMEDEAKLSHTQLLELAQQSQELHDKMMETLEKAKTLQIEADKHHQNFLQSKQKSQKIHREYLRVSEEIKVLKKELGEEREKERNLQQEETRKKLRAEVQRKLEEGKKLTFEEFKLLSEETG
jgi:uncharacterized coiled-coil DUF342 family protein